MPGDRPSMPDAAPAATARETGSAPGWGAFLRLWLRIGALGFGGPAGQAALMRHELVERRGLLSDAQYLRALNLCMLLPGPEAQQLATWCGWRLRGTAGGLAAGLLFILPGAALMAALTALYLTAGEVAAVRGALFGVQAAVLGLVAVALARMARRVLAGRMAWAFAGAAFAALFLFDAPFPVVVLAAGLLGVRLMPAVDAPADAPAARGWRGGVRAAALWLAAWLLPVALLALWLGPSHGMTTLAAFFAKVAALSFGGAYAAMAWVAQAAVETHGWLRPHEMLVALGLAESTPGPLVLSFQFVGALAGHRIDGPWTPAAGAALGMAVVLWTVFAPSFLWIFALAPHVDALTARPRLGRALAGIGAAAVGVMANLALWFALHLLWPGVREAWRGPLRLWMPDGAPDWRVAALAVAAGLALGPGGQGPARVMLAAAAAGYALTALPM